MKIFTSLMRIAVIAFAAGATFLTGCKKDVSSKEPVLSVSPEMETIAFPWEGDSKDFTVETNQAAWDVWVDQSWVQVAKNDDGTGFTVTAMENNLATAPSPATVTIEVTESASGVASGAKPAPVTMTVTQEASPYIDAFVYTCYGPVMEDDIVVMAVDDPTPRLLLAGGDGIDPLYGPNMSPDYSKVIFATYNNSGVYALDVKTLEVTNLNSSSGLTYPILSADGNTVYAIAPDYDEDWNEFSMWMVGDVATKTQTLILNDIPAYYTSMTPSGKVIYNDLLTWSWGTMNADASVQTPVGIEDADKAYIEAAALLNSEKVIYMIETDGYYSICMSAVDGSNEVELINKAYDDTFAWTAPSMNHAENLFACLKLNSDNTQDIVIWDWNGTTASNMREYPIYVDYNVRLFRIEKSIFDALPEYTPTISSSSMTGDKEKKIAHRRALR
jgi:hypothetical protein